MIVAWAEDDVAGVDIKKDRGGIAEQRPAATRGVVANTVGERIRVVSVPVGDVSKAAVGIERQGAGRGSAQEDSRCAIAKPCIVGENARRGDRQRVIF